MTEVARTVELTTPELASASPLRFKLRVWPTRTITALEMARFLRCLRDFVESEFPDLCARMPVTDVLESGEMGGSPSAVSGRSDYRDSK